MHQALALLPLLALALALTTLPAQAQIKACDALRDEIAAGLDARGVTRYTLDVVPTEAVGDGKVVGSCNAGRSRVVYRREGGGAGAPAASGSAPPAGAAAAKAGTVPSANPATRPGPARAAVGAEVSDGNSLIDRWIEQIGLGALEFELPASLRQGEPARVSLSLQLDAAADDLRRQINAVAARDAGRPRASDQLHARLLGQQWRIAPLAPTEQAPGADRVARWEWEVTPLMDGPQRLHLELSAQLSQGGALSARAVRSLERTASVEANARMAAVPFLPPRETLVRWATLGAAALFGALALGWWLGRRGRRR